MDTYKFDTPQSAIDLLKMSGFKETFSLYNYEIEDVYKINNCLVIAASLKDMANEIDLADLLSQGYKVMRYTRETDKLETLEVEIKKESI